MCWGGGGGGVVLPYALISAPLPPPCSVRIEDFNARVFKSTNKEEQQILDRGTLPTALQEVYRYLHIYM